MAFSGALLDPIPDEWWCGYHGRGLTYPEWRAGNCFFCHPEVIPAVTVKNVNGKPSRTATNRKKVYEAIRALSPRERSEFGRTGRSDA